MRADTNVKFVTLSALTKAITIYIFPPANIKQW